MRCQMSKTSDDKCGAKSRHASQRPYFSTFEPWHSTSSPTIFSSLAARPAASWAQEASGVGGERVRRARGMPRGGHERSGSGCHGTVQGVGSACTNTAGMALLAQIHTDDARRGAAMGAAASALSGEEVLTEAQVKATIGVLYDDEAESTFHATSSVDQSGTETVGLARAESFAKKHQHSGGNALTV